MAIGWLFVVLSPVAAVQGSQFHILLEDANKMCVRFGFVFILL
jgi:hypothetical protein